MDFKNIELLNAIRNTASENFRERIPVITRENLSEVASSITDYSMIRNEFVEILFDKIGLTVVKNATFENPLKEFKKNNKYGRDIEEIFVDIVKAQSYDMKKAGDEVLRRAIPELKTVFHRLNRQDFYKTTISNEQLRLAFNSEKGFNDLITSITNSIVTSDNYDEFLLMKNLIHQYGVEGKFTPIVVPVPDNDANIKECMVQIKKISNDLMFMNNRYNHAGVATNTPKENQVILINSDFDSRVDVGLLATAFNMEKADFESRKIVVDDFGGLENVVCCIVDKNWFMVYDNHFSTEQIYNPQGLYHNLFLHHWQTLSVSPFSNAVIFVSQTPTIEEITINPQEIDVEKAKENGIILNVSVTGTNNPPSSVKWEIIGDVKDGTFITSQGFLKIDKAETSPFEVKATSNFDNTITDTISILEI